MDGVIHYIRASGHWGIAVSVGLMIVHSFVPFPAELVAVANGMVYGWFWGIVITWAGAMIGAMLSFGLARKLGRPFVDRYLSDSHLQRIDAWLAHHGPGSLMFSRFIPVIAFNLINYAAGLTRIPGWTFFWVTAIGITPLTALMVAMGDQAHRVSGWLWAGLLVAGLALWLATHRVTQYKKRR